MAGVDDILNLIDAGLGRAGGWAAPIKATGCTRAGCKAQTEDGHDFCTPCLAWLRGADDDPLDPHLPEETAANPEPVDAIVAWVEMYGGLPQ